MLRSLSIFSFKLEFGPPYGMAEGTSDAFEEGWRKFRAFGCLLGYGQTLRAPYVASYRGESVGEG
jgi:hypothetical protein